MKWHHLHTGLLIFLMGRTQNEVYPVLNDVLAVLLGVIGVGFLVAFAASARRRA